MEHEHIHTIHVKQAGEKHLFQIRLPKNAKKITGILITIQPINKNPFPSDTPVTPSPIKQPVVLAEPVVLNTTSEAKATADNGNPAPANQTKNLFPLEQVIF